MTGPSVFEAGMSSCQKDEDSTKAEQRSNGEFFFIGGGGFEKKSFDPSFTRGKKNLSQIAKKRTAWVAASGIRIGVVEERRPVRDVAWGAFAAGVCGHERRVALIKRSE